MGFSLIFKINYLITGCYRYNEKQPLLPYNLRLKTLLKIRIHVPTTLLLCPLYQTPYAYRHMSQHTQDTTLPLKQGSFALSSEISSFTTLEKKTIGRKSRVWNYIRSEGTVVFLNGPGKIQIFTKKLVSTSILCLKNMWLSEQRKQVKIKGKIVPFQTTIQKSVGTNNYKHFGVFHLTTIFKDLMVIKLSLCCAVSVSEITDHNLRSLYQQRAITSIS